MKDINELTLMAAAAFRQENAPPIWLGETGYRRPENFWMNFLNYTAQSTGYLDIIIRVGIVDFKELSLGA